MSTRTVIATPSPAPMLLHRGCFLCEAVDMEMHGFCIVRGLLRDWLCEEGVPIIRGRVHEGLCMHGVECIDDNDCAELIAHSKIAAKKKRLAGGQESALGVHGQACLGQVRRRRSPLDRRPEMEQYELRALPRKDVQICVFECGFRFLHDIPSKSCRAGHVHIQVCCLTHKSFRRRQCVQRVTHRLLHLQALFSNRPPCWRSRKQPAQ